MEHEWTWDSEHENWKTMNTVLSQMSWSFSWGVQWNAVRGQNIEPFQACFNHLESMYIHNPSTWACGKKQITSPWLATTLKVVTLPMVKSHGAQGVIQWSQVLTNAQPVLGWFVNAQKNVNKCEKGVVARCKGVCKWVFNKLHSMTLLATATTTPSQPPAN